MKACLMDWECECGTSATNVLLVGLDYLDVPKAAVGYHLQTFPCAMIQGTRRRVEAVLRLGHWYVTMSEGPTK